MILYAVCWLAIMEAYRVEAQFGERFPEPSRTNKNPTHHNREWEQDEPQFASAYPSIPSKGARTVPKVPVGQEDQLNLDIIKSKNTGVESNRDSGIDNLSGDITPSAFKRQLRGIRDLSVELKRLGQEFDDLADDQEFHEHHEPYLFISVPWSLRGMKELKKILDSVLFRPLQSFANNSVPQSKKPDNQEAGGRDKRAEPTSKDSSTKAAAENIKPTTANGHFSEEEMEAIAYLLFIKHQMDEQTELIHKNIKLFENFMSQLHGVDTKVPPFPAVHSSPEKIKEFFDNFFISTKPQPVSFHETHPGNEVYRHNPSGTFFGTIWAKASEQQKIGDGKDTMKMKGDLKDEPLPKNHLQLLKDLLIKLEESTEKPVDAVGLSSAIERYFESALTVYSQRLRKLRSGLVHEPKGEL